jgi:mRNA interferase RelE/StbE
MIRARRGSKHSSDYRIVYEVHDGRLVVLVLALGHRREVYRGR